MRPSYQKFPTTVVIIPALNEEDSIGWVLGHIPKQYQSTVIVVDNGSGDGTSEKAREMGAIVIRESKRGYGSACQTGIKEAKKHDPDLIIFLDADYSDFPEDMEILVQTLLTQKLDLIIGSRVRGGAEKGAMLPQALLGNWIATRLLAFRYGYRFTDLGPFRVIRASALEKIGMKDQDFGWTMEMQVKALRLGLKVGEVSVRYRKRVGVSKITGTLKGTVLAGYKILSTLAKYSF